MDDYTFPDDGTDTDRHGARGALYGALAGVFVYPDEDVLADLTAPEAAEGIRAAAETLGLGSEAERLLDALADTDAESLESTYNDLFGLPSGGTYEVVPYEAEYTVGDDVSLAQRRIATVAGLLEAFDLERSPEFAERHDHLALELELMQIMSAQRAASLPPTPRTGRPTSNGSRPRCSIITSRISCRRWPSTSGRRPTIRCIWRPPTSRRS